MMGPLSGADIEVHTDKHCVGLVHGEKESIESPTDLCRREAGANLP